MTKSKQLFERATRTLVDGVSSPSRGPVNYTPTPIFMSHGAGAEVVDVDGNQYLDLMLGYGSLIHGHANPELVSALTEAAERGLVLATASEMEIRVAEQIADMVPSAERVRFANTGTEAAMAALRIVRGFTGRSKIIKFEGHYHGWADAYSVSSNALPSSVTGHRNDPVPVLDSSGIPHGAIRDTIVLPWNDPERVESVLRRRAGEIAAIVSEPVMSNLGVIPPAPGFLQALRDLADKYGVLLYIDETVTGFRLAPGGAQELYGVTADITTFGKALGAGFPVAAVVGRADVMDVTTSGRVLHYGTQNANPLLLAVVNRSLEMLMRNEAEAFNQLDRLARRMVKALNTVIAETGVPAIVQNAGAMLQVYFLLPGHEAVTEIRDARDFAEHVDVARYRRFAHSMFGHGVYLTPSASLHSVFSTVTCDEHVDRIVEAMAESILETSR